MTKYLFLILGTAFLAACVSGQPPDDTYTSPTTGKTTVIQSDREMCVNSCNDDYTRCMDASPASQNLPGVPSSTPGMRSGIFGASADCKSELRDCLPQCESSK
ncbi:MAG TPA: hypothetical protein VMV79_08445 [Alphaproteobacteria bacterium]|nr:hypothetical protein [Alphaproteobacteria bacterium]